MSKFKKKEEPFEVCQNLMRRNSFNGKLMFSGWVKFYLLTDNEPESLQDELHVMGFTIPHGQIKLIYKECVVL